TFRAPARIYIAQGEFKHSNIWHFPEKHSEEDIFFSFYLPEHWFEWLWNELKDRRGVPMTIRFNSFLWLRGIEAHMYYEVHYNPIRLVENSRAPISELKITVGE